MKHRIATALATIAASLVLAPTAAHAEDHRPCVSKREFFSTPKDRFVTRMEVERRWDVVGLGTTATELAPVSGLDEPLSIGHRPLIYVKWYPACGYSPDEFRVYLGYRRDTHVAVWIMRWRDPLSPAPAPHGHERR